MAVLIDSQTTTGNIQQVSYLPELQGEVAGV